MLSARGAARAATQASKLAIAKRWLKILAADPVDPVCAQVCARMVVSWMLQSLFPSVKCSWVSEV